MDNLLKASRPKIRFSCIGFQELFFLSIGPGIPIEALIPIPSSKSKDTQKKYYQEPPVGTIPKQHAFPNRETGLERKFLE
jgi:hypothetical protein